MDRMAVLLRVLLAAHAAAALAYWALQPRGFDPGSRPFLEHQVLAPLYFFCALAAAVSPARRKRTRLLTVAGLAGYWLAVAGTTVLVGRGLFAATFGMVAVAALGLSAALIYRNRTLPLAGLVPGALVGVLFLMCTWAGPESTRPRPSPPPAPATTQPFVLPVTMRGRHIAIGNPGDQILVDPSFSFDSASKSGYWTVFDYSRITLPDWIVEENTPQRLRLRASAADFDEGVLVWSQSDEIRLRAVTIVKLPIAAHLATVMRVLAPLEAAVDGKPWPFGFPDQPAQFVAFRGGRLQFLKAASDEKGPFELLLDADARDPVLSSGPWRIQVLGWAEQASREESPTAGWGVSQGAIERYNGEFIWALASTSVGRGWHAVRTGAGTYVLEAVIRR